MLHPARSFKPRLLPVVPLGFLRSRLPMPLFTVTMLAAVFFQRAPHLPDRTLGHASPTNDHSGSAHRAGSAPEAGTARRRGLAASD